MKAHTLLHPAAAVGTRWRGAARLALLALAGSSSVAMADMAEDYARADRIRSFDNRTVGGTIFPHWLDDGLRFHYLSFAPHEEPGTVFLVDPRIGSRQALFTTQDLANALARASGSEVDPIRLPRWRLKDQGTVSARVGDTDYACTIRPMRCHVVRAGADGGQMPDWAVRSPDGKWDAFIWNHNVYVRPAAAPVSQSTGLRPLRSDGDGNYRFGLSDSSGDIAGFQVTGQRSGCDLPAPPGPIPPLPRTETPPPAGAVALTTDGERLYSYGPRWKGGNEVATLDADRYRPTRGSISWSPDSRKLLVRREDIRGVGTYPLYSSTSDQPVDHTYFYAAPGAAHIPQYEFHIVDVESRKAYKVDVPPTGILLRPGGAEWSADSRQVYVVSADRAPNNVTLSVVDAATGSAHPLIVETQKTFVEMSVGGWDTIVYVSRGGDDIIWFSERDGWGHLYRYGKDGKLRNQIDDGENVVAQLIHVDEARQEIYFTAWGREPGNPYYRSLHRIRFDGSGLTTLTLEEGDHEIAWFPAGGYFLDRHSAIDRPPVTTIRLPDGRSLMEVSRGDAAGLRAIGWRPAETFTTKARDGVTDLYGVMYKPSHFDPAERYPVIVNIYPGPFQGSVGRYWNFQAGDNHMLEEDTSQWMTHGEGMSQSLAELGFIVIKLNSLGTAQRSKAMNDYFHGNVIDNGLDDQEAAVRQLARRYAWIDPDRVGITGHSGGGFAAAAGMLTHPDFFKVGVAQSGNHDFRTYGWYWGEQYMGPLQTDQDAARYARQANATYAANLKGKLMLMHGDMDCNNPPAQTLRLADALARNNKDFDLLIVPEAGHQLPPYAMRRAWDYFVTHLAGRDAPDEYRLDEPRSR